MKDILLGLTTTPGSDWVEKTKEIDKFGIKEIALFPTFLPKAKRLKLYKLLEQTCIKSIPHVHLREEDMDEAEIDYLIGRFGVKRMNLHRTSIELLEKFTKYKRMLFIENQEEIDDLFQAEVEKYSSGICLDLNHFQRYDKLMHKKNYKLFEKLMREEKIGCCHIGAFNTNVKDPGHFFHDLSEFNYIKNYRDILPHFISLELENSFEEQLKAKEYISSLIN